MPNPTSAAVAIGYALPESWNSARLSVYDVAGRLVRSLNPAPGTRGYVVAEWDGSTGSGDRAASGVYFVRLEVDGSTASRKLVLMR
jgi:flagellar hook assembly protein FlgD